MWIVVWLIIDACLAMLPAIIAMNTEVLSINKVLL